MRLSVKYDDETIVSALIGGLCFDYVLDEIRTNIAEAKNIQKSDIYETLQTIASDGARVDFISLQDWTDNKTFVRDELLALATIIDMRIVSVDGASNFTESLMDSMDEFVKGISSLKVVDGDIDTKDSSLQAELLSKVVEQMTLVSENEFLVELATKDLDFTPLQTKPFVNGFIEKKISKLNTICTKLSEKLNSDYSSLQDMVVNTNDKFYAISNEAITDTEKAEKASKAIRVINSHRALIDKVEDGLVEATEYARQLTLHKDKLRNTEVSEDMSARDAMAMGVVNEQYLIQIDEARDRLSQLKLDLEKRRKMLDGIELAFKSAIPAENDMKKYTSIKHKLQDLQNRLDIASSQVVLDARSKDLLTVNKSGLDALIQIYTDGKDVFMRNTLMSGIFASVNALYSLGENEDKVLEKSQKKFISKQLLEYSIKNSTLTKDLQTFRKIGEDIVRDVAIILGKPISLANLKEMAEVIELAVNQSSQMFDMIDKNHKDQVNQISTGVLLTDVFNV